MSETKKTFQEPTRDEIAVCAYSIFEAEGRHHGKDQDHWLQAEARLTAERKAQGKQSSGRAAAKQAKAS